jgi:hypothetical protein
MITPEAAFGFIGLFHIVLIKSRHIIYFLFDQVFGNAVEVKQSVIKSIGLIAGIFNTENKVLWSGILPNWNPFNPCGKEPVMAGTAP